MLLWRIAYDDGSTFSSDQGSWSDARADGVLWVDVMRDPYRHRLQGFDNYWVMGDLFGVFNDRVNWAWYGGNEQDQAMTWRWVADGSERVMSPGVPLGARALAGITVPDEVAWDLGLLPRGEHLPPRPG